MMHTPSGGPYQIASWPKQDIKAHIAFMVSFAKKLGESGELVSAEGLAAPDQAKRVRAGKDGKPVTDGVFPESKEFLAGFWMVDVESPKRAYEIAGEVLDAPHATVTANGKPFEMVIEVREVLGSHQDL